MGPAYLTTGVIFPGPPATPINPVQAAKDASWANQWFIDYNTKPAATNPSGPATVAAQLALITAYRQGQGRCRLQRRVGTTGRRRAGLARPPGDGGPPAVRKAGIGWAIWEDPVNMNLFDSLRGHLADRHHRRAIAALASSRRQRAEMRTADAAGTGTVRVVPAWVSVYAGLGAQVPSAATAD